MPAIPREDIERLLCTLQRPARYIGGEPNQIVKKSAFLRMAISYPDLYEVGMSNQGIMLLYERANSIDEVACERVFAVPEDCEQRLRELQLPLYSLETFTPLSELDCIGFNLSHELLYTNVLQILDLGGVPLLRRERDERHPIVIAGGEAVSNPLPMIDFIDAFFIGEGEDGIVEILRLLMEGKRSSSERGKILDDLSALEGVFVPSLDYEDSHSGATRKIQKRVYRGQPVFPLKPIVSNIRIAHERVVVEVTRGCGNLCKFCHAGYFNLPYRSYDPGYFTERVLTLLRNTGYDEISLSSLSLSDYRYLVPLLNVLLPDLIARGVSMSLPSLRVDRDTIHILEHLSDIRKSTLTFAVESACEDIRRSANKHLAVDDLIEITEYVFKNGWRSIKLYFMIGLPGCQEHDEANAIIDLLKEVYRVARGARRRVEINVTISPFVPKPHTPFQWEQQMGREYHEDVIQHIKQSLPRAISIKNHDVRMSELEGVFSRGDSALGEVILESYRAGCRLDSWREYFRYDIWMNSLNRLLPEWRSALASREGGLPWDFIESGYEKLIRFKRDHFAAGSSRKGVRGDLDIISLKNAFENFKQKYTHYRRIRVQLAKRGSSRYIPHIDFMEIIKRGLRMIDAPVAYTQGYTKRMRIAMGYPVPLGIESLSELCDLELHDSADPEQMRDSLNGVLPPGITVISARFCEGKESLMGITDAVDFLVSIAKEHYLNALLAHLRSGNPLEKRTKGGLKSIPLEDAIMEYRVVADTEKLYCDTFHEERAAANALYLRLPVGTEDSLRVDEMIVTLAGIDRDDLCDIGIVKLAQYRADGEGFIRIK